MSQDRSTVHTLREVMALAAHREGVPMLVALVDERGPMPTTTDPLLQAEGGAIAARLVEIRASAPAMRTGDNGGVVSTLVVAAHDMMISDDPELAGL